MHDFELDELRMLQAAGYAADWMENIQDGDEIVMKRFNHDDKDYGYEMVFITVQDLTWRRVFDEEAQEVNRIMKFFGVHEDGTRQHMTFGAGYPICKKIKEMDHTPDGGDA